MNNRLKAHAESRHWGHILWSRMRPFVLLLLSAYALGTLVFWSIPATGEQGTFHMSFLDALYMVAITGTTIGFGEFPVPFNAAQRGFVLVYAHLVVVCWLLFAGGFINAIQSTAFKRAFSTWNFRRQVRALKLRYMVVIGYGQTGLRVVDYLTDYGIPCVVIDRNPLKIQHLDAVSFRSPVLGHVGDGADPRVLDDAGALRSQCVAVVSLTDSDRTNLGVATAVKLLSPNRELFVRSEHDDTTRNLLSFGTEHVLDPFRLFARSLATRISQPLHFGLIDQLLDPTQTKIEVPKPVDEGHWVVCGYGRLGRSIRDALEARGLSVHIVDPAVTDAPPGWVKGLGTEDQPLRAANIDQAAGLIAGTNHDPDNLSIWMTARHSRPDLMGVGRLNRPMNKEVFEKAKWDVLMNPADVIAEELVARLRTPMLKSFIHHLEGQSEAWVQGLVQEARSRCGDEDLENWDLALTESRVPKIYSALGQMTLKQLMGPGVLCLKLRRNGEKLYRPDENTVLQGEDRLLFWGRSEARANMLGRVR